MFIKRIRSIISSVLVTAFTLSGIIICTSTVLYNYIVNVIRSNFSVLNQNYLQSSSRVIAFITIVTIGAFFILLALFVANVKFDKKHIFRLGRLVSIGFVLFLLAAFCWLLALFLLGAGDPDANLILVYSDTLFGFATEMGGAVLLLFFLDIIHKGWEESKEPKDDKIDELKKLINERDEKQEKIIQTSVDSKLDEFKAFMTELNEKQERVSITALEDEWKNKLRILMDEWEEKAKTPENPNNPSKKPLKPIKKGRIEAYQQAIKDIQKLIN